MAYATTDDVFKRYPPISTMVGTQAFEVTTVDVASIYIQDAESYINAYLAPRYMIPLGTEPLITQLAADIALYRLIEDRAPRVPDIAVKRWTNAASLLEMLRDGKMWLLSSSTQVTSGGDQDAWSSSQDTPPIFMPPESYVTSWCLVDSDPMLSLT